MTFLLHRYGGVACIAATIVLLATIPCAAQTTTTRPVMTRDLDNPDHQEIYQQEVTLLLFDPVQSDQECLDPVPTGKRLVIEHVTARVSLPVGQSAYLGLKIAGSRFGTFLPLIPHGTLNSRQYFVVAQPARLRVAAGQRICILMEREPGDGQATNLVTVSGYMINMP